MEDFDAVENNKFEDVEPEEEQFEEESQPTFDDVVSFTMLVETGITLAGIFIFFVLILLNIV